MSDNCPLPLIQHRVRAPQPLGSASARIITECSDPRCDAAPDRHSSSLPCRWAWPLAHGKVFNGAPFPKRRCPGCEHIRRAGNPDESALAG